MPRSRTKQQKALLAEGPGEGRGGPGHAADLTALGEEGSFSTKRGKGGGSTDGRPRGALPAPPRLSPFGGASLERQLGETADGPPTCSRHWVNTLAVCFLLLHQAELTFPLNGRSRRALTSTQPLSGITEAKKADVCRANGQCRMKCTWPSPFPPHFSPHSRNVQKGAFSHTHKGEKTGPQSCLDSKKL